MEERGPSPVGSGRRRRRRKRHRRGWKSWIRRQWRFGCLYLAFLVILIGYALLRPPAGPEELSPEQKHASLQRVDAFRTELQAIKADARAGRVRQFSLSLGEADINTFLRDDPQAMENLSRYEVDRAWVRLAEAGMEVTAIRPVSGLPLSMTATLKPEVSRDHSVRFHVADVAVGRVGVSLATARDLAERIARALEGQLVDARIQYESVELKDRVLSFRGVTAPRASP